jgi:hypothetical protein
MDFKTIVDITYSKKKDWDKLTITDKETFFFIFNRYMSKKYPKQAQFFNDKAIDKATAMDVWFSFLSKEIRTPVWFWRGPTKKKDPEIKGWKVIQEFWECPKDDIYLLCELYSKELKEEIKRIEQINLEQNK